VRTVTAPTVTRKRRQLTGYCGIQPAGLDLELGVGGLVVGRVNLKFLSGFYMASSAFNVVLTIGDRVEITREIRIRLSAKITSIY